MEELKLVALLDSEIQYDCDGEKEVTVKYGSDFLWMKSLIVVPSGV